MMDRFTRSPWLTSIEDPIGGRRFGAEATDPPNSFERLVRIMRSNDRAQAELASLRAQIRAARAYLATPDGHRALGEAHLGRLKVKSSLVLVVLRANRIEARQILAGVRRTAANDFHPAPVDRRNGWDLQGRWPMADDKCPIPDSDRTHPTPAIFSDLASAIWNLPSLNAPRRVLPPGAPSRRARGS